MSRQPFLPKYQDFHYVLGASALKQIPDFVSRIGLCAASWSYVDHQMALLLGVLLGAQNEAAIAIFSLLKRASNQRESLETAGLYRLSGEATDLLDALLRMAKSVGKERNDLIHGQWGSLTHPDPTKHLSEPLAVWIASEHHANWNIKAVEKGMRKEYDDHADLKKKLCVYSLNDMDYIYNRIVAVRSAFADFFIYARDSCRSPRASHISDEQLDRLKSLPHIQEALRDRDRQRKSP